MKSAVLAMIETYADTRIAVVRFKDGDRGWSEMRVERLRRGEWVPSGTKIRIPNNAVFLVRDAMDRSCDLARGDQR